MMVSQEWLDRYFERHVDHAPGYWNPSADPILAERIRHFHRLGLERLNALSPNDPFWHNTNREPTLAKVTDYFANQLRHDPGDEESRWIVACRLLHNGRDNELGWILEPLLEKDFSNIEWIMAARRWCLVNWGFSDTSSMRDLLVALRSRLPELTDKLDALRRGASPHRLLMIDEVLNLNSQEWTVALSPPGHS